MFGGYLVQGLCILYVEKFLCGFIPSLHKEYKK